MVRAKFKRALTYILLAVWGVICIFPLYWVALASLKSEEAIIHGPRYLPFIDFDPSLDAWRFILFDSHENLLWPLYNSLVVSLFSTIIATSFACLLLYGLTRFRNRSVTNGSWLLWLVLSSRILAPATIVIPLYLMAQVTGLLDSRTALVITYSAINLPVAVWLLMPAFGSRETEQEESATLEGASHIYVLWDILLPMLLRSIAGVALIVFILCWNEYFFAAFLTTDKASTLTPWMVGQLALKEAQIGGEPEEWAHLSAATMLMVVPLIFFASSVQRIVSRRSVAK